MERRGLFARSQGRKNRGLYLPHLPQGAPPGRRPDHPPLLRQSDGFRELHPLIPLPMKGRIPMRQFNESILQILRLPLEKKGAQFFIVILDRQPEDSVRFPSPLRNSGQVERAIHPVWKKKGSCHLSKFHQALSGVPDKCAKMFQCAY